MNIINTVRAMFPRDTSLALVKSIIETTKLAPQEPRYNSGMRFLTYEFEHGTIRFALENNNIFSDAFVCDQDRIQFAHISRADLSDAARREIHEFIQDAISTLKEQSRKLRIEQGMAGLQAFLATTKTS